MAFFCLFDCLFFFCSYEVSGSADEGKRKSPSNRQELGVNSLFTVFLARISVSAHDLLGKARLLFVFYEGRAYFVDQSQREVKQNECGGGLLSTCIENCSVAAK